MAKEDYMLTTFDNPFNPFDDFIAWWKYDLRLGHDTCGLLAKEANTSSIFSDEINEAFIDDAMDKICKDYPMIFKKVLRDDYKKKVS